MRELNRIGIAIFNLYLISSFNIIQIVSADRPKVAESVGDKSNYQQNSSSKTSSSKSRESRQFNDDFAPSLKFESQFGQKLNFEQEVQEIAFGGGSSQNLEPSSNQVADPRASQVLEPDTAAYTFRRSQYQKPVRGRRRKLYSGGRNRFRPSVSRQDDNLSVYQKYLGNVEISRPPPRTKHRQRLNSILTPNYVRFNNDRPQPLRAGAGVSSNLGLGSATKKPGGGLLDLFLSGLGGNCGKTKKEPENMSEPSYEFVNYDSIDDYNEIEKEFGSDTILSNDDYDDFNIDYSDSGSKEPTKLYDFKDVLYSIRDNETRIETFKKFLSAASGMSTRASTDPSFMVFNMPVTLLSILGGFYALSAVGVLAYKYALLTAGSDNGAAVAIIPVAVSFLVPLLLVTAYLVIRTTVDGQVSFSHLARGDFNEALRPDFDPVSFVYDAAIGSTALLGVGWIVSVVL